MLGCPTSISHSLEDTDWTPTNLPVQIDGCPNGNHSEGTKHYLDGKRHTHWTPTESAGPNRWMSNELRGTDDSHVLVGVLVLELRVRRGDGFGQL